MRLHPASLRPGPAQITEHPGCRTDGTVAFQNSSTDGQPASRGRSRDGDLVKAWGLSDVQESQPMSRDPAGTIRRGSPRSAHLPHPPGHDPAGRRQDLLLPFRAILDIADPAREQWQRPRPLVFRQIGVSTRGGARDDGLGGRQMRPATPALPRAARDQRPRPGITDLASRSESRAAKYPAAELVGLDQAGPQRVAPAVRLGQPPVPAPGPLRAQGLKG